MTDQSPVTGSPSPKRVLGGFDAGCIVVGAIIGVGIFFFPKEVVRVTGSGTLALVAWAVAGVMAMCGALVFAELGARNHGTGAQYEILRDTYGPLPAFMFVFCNATAIQAGAVGVIAIICVKNIAAAIGADPPGGWGMLGAASILVVGLMGANILGVRSGSAIQNITVLAKVLTLLLVTAVAMFTPAHAGPEPAPETWSAGLSPIAGIMAALSPAFFAFGGWQHALWISGEVKNPKRTLPRAIIGGVAVVVVVYLLANWAYISLLGPAGMVGSQALAADAVGSVWPTAGRRFIAAAVAFSAFGVLNAQLLSGPRLVYRMAIEGQFFRPFGVLSTRFGTPWAAIALIGVMAIALLALVGEDGVGQLGTGVVFIDGVFFGLTAITLFVARARDRKASGTSTPPKDAGFRVPGYPIVPAIFVVGELALLVGSYFDPAMRQAAWIGIAWIFVAGALYFLIFRKASARPKAS